MPEPRQVPGFPFPGAEYFALAPDRTLAMGPRLMQIFTSTTTSVAASTQGFILNQSLVLNPVFTTSQAVYIVRAELLILPADSGAKLQVQGARLGLGGPGGIGLDIGLPTATLATPSQPLVAVYERDALVTWLDFNPPATGPLAMALTGTLGVLNTDAGAAHSFSLQLQCVWHNLSGFVQ